MKKIVQVLIASFAIGMLASFGVASAEIYMVQFGGFDNSYWTFFVPPTSDSGIVLCAPGEKVIAGSAELKSGTGAVKISHPIFDQGANLDQEGWRGELEASGGSTVRIWAHCLMPLSMAVGGLALQPDTTALILAYGIMNSYWMLPTAVGIGVGIYLVKRRF